MMDRARILRWVALAVIAASVSGCGSDKQPVTQPPEKSSVETSEVEPANQDSIRFTDVTAETGIDFVYQNGTEAGHHAILESLGGGIALIDFDRDGFLDLFATGGGGYEGQKIFGLPSALYRQIAPWRFDTVTEQAGAGFSSEKYTHGCFAADYDNDGFTDVLVTGYGGLQLWKNQGDGTFELQAEIGLQDESWSTAAGWGDLNGDGNLDLYVAHYVDWSFDNNPFCEGPSDDLREICPPRAFNGLRDTVFFSQGDGMFTDVTEEIGIVEGGKGLGVALGDVDVDGDLDIYVGNDTTNNFLYLNDGQGNLTEVASFAGCAVDDNGTPNGSMGVEIADYNGDGLPDLWAANFEVESFALYRNDGNAQFLHVSQVTGVTALNGLFVGFGTAFLDIDWDGDQDVVVSNGHVIKYPKTAPLRQVPLLLINEEQRTLRRHRFLGEGYFSEPHMGRGLAVGDVDNDGDQDLIFGHTGERLALLRNDGEPDGSWLQVKLQGRGSNRDAIGAVAILHTDDGDQIRLVKGGTSYLSQRELTLFWGVAKSARVSSLDVHWPSGHHQTVTDLALNEFVTVSEADSPPPKK